MSVRACVSALTHLIEPAPVEAPGQVQPEKSGSVRETLPRRGRSGGFEWRDRDPVRCPAGRSFATLTIVGVATSVAAQRVVPEKFPEYRRGVTLGATAYTLWGLFPLYWTLLAASGALEALAHRMVWSLVVMAIVLLATGRLASARAVLASRRRLGLLEGG